MRPYWTIPFDDILVTRFRTCQGRKRTLPLMTRSFSLGRRGVVVPDKALSFHAQAVRCFNKGKAAHGLEFGRAFQLGRIGGNFLVVGACTSIRMEDKASIRPMIEAHQDLFGQGVLQSFGTDKGYYSQANHDYLCAVSGLKECGLQQPGLALGSLAESEAEVRARLADRRAGIEPLIGHAKQGGQLGQSRMKTDDTTLAAGTAR